MSNGKEIPGGIKDQEKPEPEQPKWGEFKTPTTYQGESDPTADEGIFSYVMRNAVSNASRVAEQIAGSYGNIEKFAKDSLASSPKIFGGPIGWAVSELMGPERWEKFVKGEGHQMFPTSEQLKEVSQKATGGYTKPKTKGEKEFHEFSEDVGSTLTGRNAPQLMRNLVIPAAANVAKKVVKDTGFGDDAANVAKAAVWIPLTLANSVNAPAYASNLMNEGRNGVPANVQFNVPRFMQRLQTIENTLLSNDPRTALARQQVAQLRNNIANGQTSVREGFNMYGGLNAAKRDRGLFALNRNDQNFARRAIDQVRDGLRDEIQHSASAYPQALNSWQNGVNAWATIHRSNAITNWVQSVAKGPYAKILTGPAAGLFGIGAYGAKMAPMVALPGTAAVASSYKVGQTLMRMWGDPNLRNYYWGAINGAMGENLPTFISNYNKLNKGLEKSEPVKKKSSSNNK
jgi:hypothetical protein